MALERIPATELVAREPKPIPWIPILGLSGKMVEGWMHLLCAYPKVGKTTLLMWCIRGWLQKGYQVLIFTEEAQELWEMRLPKNEDWSGLTLIESFGKPISEMLEEISVAPEQIIVVDTLRNILRFKNENDNSEIPEKMEPWITACRDANKTFLGLHHENKEGGEHGRGVTGGHAFLGIVDIVIELKRVPNSKNRRILSSIGRLVDEQEFIYEMDEDDKLHVLGASKSVELDEVKNRVLDLLDPLFMRTTKELLEKMDEPKPSDETLRKALDSLRYEKKVVRDPEEPKKGATYRWTLA